MEWSLQPRLLPGNWCALLVPCQTGWIMNSCSVSFQSVLTPGISCYSPFNMLARRREVINIEEGLALALPRLSKRTNEGIKQWGLLFKRSLWLQELEVFFWARCSGGPASHPQHLLTSVWVARTSENWTPGISCTDIKSNYIPSIMVLYAVKQLNWHLQAGWKGVLLPTGTKAIVLFS